MFTFIKKLFGFDKETMKDAGVQIEQAPYKIEKEMFPVSHSDVVIKTKKLDEVNSQPITKISTDTKKKSTKTSSSKKSATKKETSKQPRSRKPKVK
jgi:hypothetical protein